MPMSCVRRLVFMSEIWNNLPAAILRSRISFIPLATTRGSRYFGRSRMNWAALVNHGLSAMSVYIDVAFLRILFGAVTFVVMTLLGFAAAVSIRFMTTLAIPGWTTIVVGVLGVVLVQVTLMVISMLLLVLAGRSGRPIVPIADISIFVASRRRYELKPLPPSTERTGCNEPVPSGHRT
jgi:polyisoprenyl-phosphate glycosyltransferase